MADSPSRRRCLQTLSRLTAAGVVVTLSACTTVVKPGPSTDTTPEGLPWSPDPWTAEALALRVDSATPNQIFVKLQILNPTPSSVSVTGLRLSLTLNQRPVAQLRTPAAAELAPGKVWQVELPMELVADPPTRQALGLSDKAPRGPLSYEIEGEIATSLMRRLAGLQQGFRGQGLVALSRQP